MSNISAEEQAQVNKYRSLLYTTQDEMDPATGTWRQVSVPTPMRQAYEARRQAYQAAVVRYNDLRLKANTSADQQAVLDFAQNAPLYRSDVKDAMATWITAGYKQEVEGMEAYIAQVMSRAAD